MIIGNNCKEYNSVGEILEEREKREVHPLLAFEVTRDTDIEKLGEFIIENLSYKKVLALKEFLDKEK